MRAHRLILCAAAIIFSGCALQEVRSKSKIGPDFRHSGTRGTDEERWTVRQGIELKWDQGITTGLTYRRRDVNHGSGNHDNGVWFEFSVPLWKAAKESNALARQVKSLERRLATLEMRLAAGAAPAEAQPEPQIGDN